MEMGLSYHLTLPQWPGFLLRPPLRSVGASLLCCPLQAVSTQRQAGERAVNFSLATLLREMRGWFPSTPATLRAVEKLTRPESPQETHPDRPPRLKPSLPPGS